jgi:hypothetical protein
MVYAGNCDCGVSETLKNLDFWMAVYGGLLELVVGSIRICQNAIYGRKDKNGS